MTWKTCRTNYPEKEKTALIAAVITAILAVMMLFFAPTSWPHDDWDISLVLMQRFGPENYINFVNVGLCWLIKSLSLLSLNINWYFWLRWLFTAVSFVFFTYTLFILQPLPVAIAVDGLVKFVFWQVSFLDCNFTRNAGLFAAVGLMLLTLYVRKTKGLWTFGIGLLLWLMGTLWRPKAALLTAPFVLVLLLYGWLSRISKKEEIGIAFKVLIANRRLWAAFGCAVLITAGAWIAQSAFWGQPEWAEFQQFNDDRSQIFDYGGIDEQIRQDVYQKNGLSESDIWCLHNRAFADPEVFTPELFKNINSELSQHHASFQIVLSEMLLPLVIQLPLQVRSFLAFCLIGGMMFLLGGWRQRLAVLAAGGGSIVICIVLLWQAYLPERVLEALFIAAIAIILLLPPQKKLYKRRWTALGAIICVACLAVGTLRLAPRFQWPRVNTVPAGKTGSAAIDTAAIDKEHIYIWDAFSTYVKVQNAYQLCALPPMDFFDHNTILGGYHEFAPYTAASRKAMEAENPMRALVENPKALLVDDYMPENILAYVQQHYAPQATLSAAKDMGDGLWALALTAPLKADEKQPLRWYIKDIALVNKRSNWYTMVGKAEGLEQAEDLWLRVENGASESRCYRLVNHGDGSFGTGLYLDWTAPDADLKYTLLWKQSDKIYESAVKKESIG